MEEESDSRGGYPVGGAHGSVKRRDPTDARSETSPGCVGKVKQKQPDASTELNVHVQKRTSTHEFKHCLREL